MYCLVRASSAAEATERVLRAFTDRGLAIPEDSSRRIVSLASDLSKADLGVSPTKLLEMHKTVSLVIHNAWAVNFNLGIHSFEEQHIKGTYNLIGFALSVERSRPASFVFCSSISVAVGMPPVTIPEMLVGDLKMANMGYGQSKLVTEYIVNNAAINTDLNCCVVRIGQIVGDSAMGLWNDSESIPLIIRSALTLGCLPRLNEVLYPILHSRNSETYSFLRSAGGFQSIALQKPSLN